jgi:hypothetical protein
VKHSRDVLTRSVDRSFVTRRVRRDRRPQAVSAATHPPYAGRPTTDQFRKSMFNCEKMYPPAEKRAILESKGVA